jgi:acetyl esterase/lipase
VLLHGGFWREVWTRDTIDSLAVDLRARGYATWNVEYRRIPPVGAWRTTIGDVVDAIDALPMLAASNDLDLDNVTVFGHSAGAHLATMAARQCDQAIHKLVLLGGVLDLDVLPPEHDALGLFLGDELDSHRDAVNPRSLGAIGIPSLVVHGTEDTSVDPAHAVNFATAVGDEATLVSLDGSTHWDIIDGDSAAWKSIADSLR